MPRPQSLNGKSVAIILPAYNEELTIAEVLRSFHESIPQAGLFVIDNNSKDRTAEIAKLTITEIGAHGAVLSEMRQGKANAVRRGLNEVNADVYVMVDADNTYPAAQVWDLITPVLSGEADMVNGDRRSSGDYRRENKRLLHNFGNNLVQKLTRIVSGTEIVDIMSGYRAMSRYFVDSYPILVEGFQLETDMCLFAAQTNMRTLEVPISYTDRPEGSHSKLSTFQDGLKVLRCIFDMYRQFSPFTFFAVTAAFFILLSLICGSVVVHEWLITRYITHVPLSILAVAFGLLGIIALGTGVTLDAVNYKNRRDLEYILKRNYRPRHSADQEERRKNGAS